MCAVLQFQCMLGEWVVVSPSLLGVFLCGYEIVVMCVAVEFVAVTLIIVCRLHLLLVGGCTAIEFE